MKALVLKDVGNICLQTIEKPNIHDSKILLKVRSGALCRTDAKMWKMGHRDLVLPRVLGHEICGTLEESGQRMVVWPGNACGQCTACMNEFENLCESMQIIGFHLDGGLAEYVMVREENLIPVPDDLSDELACLAEPLACTINALKMAQVRKGSKVLIYGAGPVGLMMALAIRSADAEPTVYDINPAKIDISRQFQEKSGIRVVEKIPEIKWHTVINAAPSMESFHDGISRLMPGGSFCIFSGFSHNTGSNVIDTFSSLNHIHYHQLKVSGAYGCTRQQIRLALDLLRNHGDAWFFLMEKIIAIEDVPAVLPRIWAGVTLKYIVKFE